MVGPDAYKSVSVGGPIDGLLLGQNRGHNVPRWRPVVVDEVVRL